MARNNGEIVVQMREILVESIETLVCFAGLLEEEGVCVWLVIRAGCRLVDDMKYEE